MEDKQFIKFIQIITRVVQLLVLLILFVSSLVIIGLTGGLDSFTRDSREAKVKPIKKAEPEIVNGVHLATGLKEGKGLAAVIRNCTNCHSSKLITQNRMSRERWKNTIVWMQETQNLWPLGDQEEEIINYLSINYAPENKGRRAPLTTIDWYVLE
jgi:hypothetical protein